MFHKCDFGLYYKVVEGQIKHGDMALNGDTGDVIYIDEDCDLNFRNQTCEKLQLLSLKEMLSYYYEIDIDNCTMTNEMWIAELTKALVRPKEYLSYFIDEFDQYNNERKEVSNG